MKNTHYSLSLLAAVLYFVVPARAVDFAKDIQPIFETSCYACHGSKLQMGGLRLDSTKAAPDRSHAAARTASEDECASAGGLDAHEAGRMTGVNVQVKGVFRSARAIAAGKELAVSRSGEYAAFMVPSLEEYELVELQ